MNSLAIPAAPPPAAANAGNGATPATGDERFGDTLRKAQTKPQTQADRHSADDAPAAPKHAERPPDEHAKDETKSDKPAPGDTPPQPIQIVAVPIAAATLRQPPAAGGKPLPAVATPTPAAVTGTPKPAHAPAPPIPTTATAQLDVTAAALPGTKLADMAQTSALATSAHADQDGGKDAPLAKAGPNDFTAHLSQLIGAQQAPASNPAPAPVQLTMQAPPAQQPQFAQETAQHISWLAGQGIDKAEIQLNPRKLGPIHVEITNHHDRVDVSFAVQHPQTVHALQQTLPQLHDMLAQQGLNLGQASVGQQSSGQQHAAFAHHAGGGNGHGTAAGNDADIPLTPRTLRIATPGRVDDFA